jgi:hypothetical protein
MPIACRILEAARGNRGESDMSEPVLRIEKNNEIAVGRAAVRDRGRTQNAR